MNDKEFFDFVSKQYQDDLGYADLLYRRAALLLTAIVLVTGVSGLQTVFLDLRNDGVHAVAVLLRLGVLVLVLVASFCIVRGILPRPYQRLTDLRRWQAWRVGRRAELDAWPGSDEQRAEQLAKETADQLLYRMLDAQADAKKWNLERETWLSRAVYAVVATWAVAFLVFVANGEWMSPYERAEGAPSPSSALQAGSAERAHDPHSDAAPATPTTGSRE